MYRLNKKIEELQPYRPLEGDFEVRLDANESFIGLDEKIAEEVCEAIKKIPFNRYPDPMANRCREAFAALYSIDKECLTAGNGSDELISVIINGFFERGDRVVITSPDFTMYGFYCHIAEAEAEVYQKRLLEVSVDEIIERAREKDAKGVILSNPCNPTSKGLCRQDILRLAESLSDKLIVIDEAYMEFWDESIIKHVADFDNVILLKTCSKAFGLAAIRLGFAVANRRLSRAIAAIKSPYNVNTMTNVAGSIVLSHADYLKDCIRQIREQRDKLYCMLKEVEKERGGIKVYSSCANFVLVECPDASGVYGKLLQRGIAVRQLGGYLRVTAGSDGELARFISAFKEAL
jgi:histidinol-phosphate aminotransferase